MEVNEAIQALAEYAVRTGLIVEEERVWAVNSLLEGLKLDSWTAPQAPVPERPLAAILEVLLDDAHAVDHFVEAIVDVGKPGAHPPHDRRAIALIDNHHDQHRRENRDRHQRHPPVEAKHRHQHRADQRGAAQYRSHHRHVQIANDFRIVGYP